MAKNNVVSTKCTECNTSLIEKNGKYGVYYTCPNWHREWYKKPGKCKGCGFVSQDNYNRAKKLENGLPPVNKQPNEDQSTITDNFAKIIRQSGGHKILVNADAGTGKSTLIASFLSRLVPSHMSAIYLVFNNKAARDMRQNDDLAPWVEVSTFHALSNKLLPKRKGKPNQYAHIDYLLGNEDAPGPMHGFNSGAIAVIKIVGMLKNHLFKPTNENIDYILENYDLDLPSQKKCPLELILQYVPHIYDRAKNINWQEYDFNDMLVDPILLDMSYPKYDYILVDEFQDQNDARLAIIERIAHKNTIFGYVGDQKQAIMGFTGSHEGLMNKTAQEVDIQFPLSITYRYGSAVLDHVKSYFPDLKTITKANYDDEFAGNVPALQFDALIEKHKNDGLMILCRNNAPLVGPCLDLLRQGYNVKILGKDIARSLIGTMLGHGEKTDNPGKILNSLHDKLSKMVAKNARPDRIDYMRDKIATIEVLAENCETLDCVIDKINKIFTDNPQNNTILFSTAHKSKGGEANVVMIIKPELFNLTGGFNTQEDNLWYVALTRAKSHCYILRSDM